MPFVDSYKTKILNSIFNNTPINLGVTWVALYITLPDPPNNPGVEVQDPIYQRFQITFTVSGITAVSNEIDYLTAGQDWGFVLGFGLYTSQIGGELSYYDSFTDIYDVKKLDQYIVKSITMHFNNLI
jgi:hypothetical protein